MNEIKAPTKPTLEGLLNSPEEDFSAFVSPQKLIFPKINTKLKKTQFTKYKSAFISAKSCSVNPQSYQIIKSSQISPKEKINTEVIINDNANQFKLKFQLHKNVWKVNKKNCHSNIIQNISKNEKCFLQNQCISQLSRKNQRLKQKNQRESAEKDCQNKSNQKSTLITQIRQLNISPILYPEKNQNVKDKLRTKDQINQNINQSNKIISLIKRNYRRGFFDSSLKNNGQSLEKLQQKLGLFSYLKRNFVTKKQQLTSEKIKEYFKTSSNKKLQAKISFQSRTFLQEKLNNDYHSHKEVERLKEDLSEKGIKQQIKSKQIEYQQQYSKKYNVPYFSFLSLPKKLKVKVLENLTEPHSRSHRIK